LLSILLLCHFLPSLLLLTLGYLIIMIVPIVTTFVIVLLTVFPGSLAATEEQQEKVEYIERVHATATLRMLVSNIGNWP
jgi:uncharacterized membrane protein